MAILGILKIKGKQTQQNEVQKKYFSISTLEVLQNE